MSIRVAGPAAAYVGVGLALTVAYFAVSAPLSHAVLYDTIAGSAFVAMLLGVRLHRPTELRAWRLLAAGVGAFLAGEITWDVYLLAFDADPWPSVADAFYLLGYGLLAAGLVLLVRGRSRGFTRISASLFDAAILTVAAAVLFWVFLVEPYAQDPTLSFLEQALSAAYPLGDVLLLAVLAGLVLASGARTPSFFLLVAAVVGNVLADTAFGIAELSGAYTTGAWIDLGWLLGYVSFGAAALHPSMATLAQFTPQIATRLTPARTTALAAAAITAPVVLAVEAARGHDPSLWLFAGGAAVLPLLVLARLATLFRELELLGAERQIILLSERAARSEAETAQRLLAEQNERLRDVDRLKDEFVALVSHELRTPLTSVTGYIEILREEADELTEEHRGFLDIVDRNAKRLLRLVGDLLFVAQVEAGKLALEVDEVDLGALALECLDNGRPRAEEKGVEVVMTLRPHVVVEGDRARLAQLVDNLLSNAVKFTPRGGRIELSVTEADGRAALFVADNGMGIPFVEQRRLFDRFFRSSTAQAAAIEGTGLGLTISKAIADAHGGEIEVDSVEGKGTTFRVLLPLGAGDTHSSTLQAGAARAR